MDKNTNSEPGVVEATSNSALSRLPNNEAGEVVKNAMAYAGGWDQWQEKKNFTYTKKIEYLDSLGNKEREVVQLHQYQLRPTFKASISWEEDGTKFKIINTGKQAFKLKDGKKLSNDDDTSNAWNSSFGSHYVMCMPFKLIDPGTVLAYQGIDTLAGGQLVHSIKATYQKGAGSAAGMHTWWYYFDTENYSSVANFLDYGDGYSYTQYEAFEDIGGVMMNQLRHSYATNAQRELLYLRAIYTNMDMKFNSEFKEDLFDVTE